MNVLLIGTGGREHALAHKLSSSESADRLFWTPGNGATSEIAENPGIRQNDFEGLARFAREQNIELTVVGPEAPLVDGLADRFKRDGLLVFGPSADGARIEGSKLFAKQIMQQQNIPTAGYAEFDRVDRAFEHLKSVQPPYVIKADGLAAGKGVIIAGSLDEARQALEGMLEQKQFGESGSMVVIEEFMTGEEATVLALCDGKTIVPLISSQDHKPVFDGDKGPNTGGMGAIAPAPVVTPKVMGRVMDTILLPLVEGFNLQNINYRGVIYAGLMIENDQPRVVEFNCRFGDPEAEAVLPLLQSDLGEALHRAAAGTLRDFTLDWRPGYACDVVMVSGGYPGSYKKGLPISGLDAAAESDDVFVFHAGTRRAGDVVVTDGGRVLNVVALGDTLGEAVEKSYRKVESIAFEGAHVRRDIGHKGLARVK